MTDSPDRRHSGFKRRTRLAQARDVLSDIVSVMDRTETVPLSKADGRVLGERVRAKREVPHYPRAAMDGYAVRAPDTYGASDRSPTVLTESDGPVEPGEAVRVHTGSEVPDGADAVVMIEHVETIGSDVEVRDAVAEGENVGPVGEDVERGTTLYRPGHRLRPSDLGLLKSVAVETVTVRKRPEVAVIPTGEEVVQADPDPGEIIETNGLTVSTLLRRWGGRPRYRDVVTDDKSALKRAIERDLDADLVVTTGGSSVGARDLLPEVLDGLGEVLVHGVAIKPGHPVGFGHVEETPVLMLPGYPVSCIVNAFLFLRPAIADSLGTALIDPPTVEARLDAKIPSEPGVRTLARVQLSENGSTDAPGADVESEDQIATPPIDRSQSTDAEADSPPEDATETTRIATPVSASGAGVLSSVALSDGWVQVPESVEGIAAGELVTVERWEAMA
ncbi:MAG: gephyrin-like molybdotransferase Glp [Halodesulfurarchaeum sp.]